MSTATSDLRSLQRPRWPVSQPLALTPFTAIVIVRVVPVALLLD
jgi:hypothetical protein